MANPITFITPQTLTFTNNNAFQTVDVSAFVPSGASGVLIRTVWNGASSNNQFAARKNGSTDAFSSPHRNVGPVYTMIGLNASRQLQLLANSGGGGVTATLLAYFDPGSVVFFDNATTFAPGASSWTDANLASATGADTAIAAILYKRSTRALATEIGWRRNGSTQDLRGDFPTSENGSAGFYDGCVIVPCDGSEIFELWRNSTNFGNFNVVGYITRNYVGLDPFTDISQAGTGAFADADTVADNALALMVEGVATVAALTAGIRENGGSVAQAALDAGQERFSALVTGDAGGVVELYRSAVTMSFYLSGYFTVEAAGTIPRAANQFRRRRAA